MTNNESDMIENESIYEQVAERCSAFSAASRDTYVNRAKDSENISCTNCSHFNEHNHCNLDLYDRIVAANKLDAES